MSGQDSRQIKGKVQMKLGIRLKLELMVKAHVKVQVLGHKVKATVQFEANC